MTFCLWITLYQKCTVLKILVDEAIMNSLTNNDDQDDTPITELGFNEEITCPHGIKITRKFKF